MKLFFEKALHGSVMLTFKAVGYVAPYRWPKSFAGAGSSVQLCAAIAERGHKKVFVVTSPTPLRHGLLNPMFAELDKQGVAYHVFDQVKPDPTIEQIEAAVTELKAEHCDAILALGGGSCIDAAKVIGARAKNDKPIRKLTGMFKIHRGMLPLYAVPTTAGTGSEVTIAAVVTDPEQQRKLPIMDFRLMPKACALDGALMTGLPASITAATGMDALTHAVEAYISRNAVARTDKKAIEAVQLIMANLAKAVSDGADVQARQNMARASHLAGIAFTQSGVGYIHGIAHNFGALYHVPHGRANAIIMPYVLDYSLPNCAARLAQLARASQIGSAHGSDESLAAEFIAQIRMMNQTFEIPEQLDVLQAADIPKIARAARDEARFTYAVPRYMDQTDCENIVRKMLIQPS